MAFSPNTNRSSIPAPPLSEVEGLFSPDAHRQMSRVVDDAIESITRSRAFFREEDVVRNVWNRSEKEFDLAIVENDRFETLIRYHLGQKTLVSIGNTGTWTTPEMVEMEQKMIAYAGIEDGQHVLPELVVREAISKKPTISEEQIRAVEASCISPRRVSIVEGTAGAGKSFTMQVVKEAYQAMGYSVMGTALSWNAAKVLESSIRLDGCIALQRLITKFREARKNGTDFFRRPTLLIVDEAGMIGTRQMTTLLEETSLSKYPVKVVLTGDSLQVKPIDAGNSLETLVAYHGTVRIDTIQRQRLESHRRSVRRFSQRQSGKALYPFVHQEAIRWCRDETSRFNMVARDFLSFVYSQKDQEKPKTALILAASNQEVATLNQTIRSAYRKLGLLDTYEVELEVTNGRDKWRAGFSVGDQVVLRSSGEETVVYHIDKNAPVDDESTWVPIRKGVYNRNSGRIVAIRRSRNPIGSHDFILDLEGEQPGRVIINSRTYRDPEKAAVPMVHNFATTIYASQGQTVDKVFFLDGPMTDFRTAYVAMSRHRENVEVYLNVEELHNRLDRMLGKRSPLGVKEKKVRFDEAPESLPVKLGRYRRSEMLQAVAKSWGRDSQNPTAMLYERKKRLGLDRVSPQEERLRTQIQSEPHEDNLDFIPECDPKIPLLDMEALMRLPEPIVEAELVRPSEVQVHNDRMKGNEMEMPLRIPVSPPSPPAASAAPAGLLDRAISWWKKHQVDDAPAVAPVPSSRLFDTTPAFAPASAPVASPLSSRTFRDILLSRQAPVQAPFLAPGPRVGRIENGCLVFDDVPQTLGQEGPSQEVSGEFLKKAQGFYWAQGRHEEPRILARDQTGEIVARYRLDGQCVVGEGFPPMMLNPSTENAPIMIVPGAREFFLMGETMREKYADQPERIPHLVWSAKDVDWGLIARDLKGKKIIIARSRHDESQAQWAASLAKLLLDEWKIETIIIPKIEAATPTTPASRASMG